MSDDEAQILRVNEDENRWMVDADVDALDLLLAPGFVLVHITGYTQPKTEWLAEIASGSMRYHAIRQRSVAVAVDGDTATLVARNAVEATIWGSHATWPLEMTTQLIRVDGVWRPSHSRATTY
jgi:hypothetical protein